MKGRKVTFDVQQTSDSTKVRSRKTRDLPDPAIQTVWDQKSARKTDASAARACRQWMRRRSLRRPGARWCVTVTTTGPRFPRAISTDRYAGRFHPEPREHGVIKNRTEQNRIRKKVM